MASLVERVEALEVIVDQLQQNIAVLEARADLAKLRLDLVALWIGKLRTTLRDWYDSEIWFWNRSEPGSSWVEPPAVQARADIDAELTAL